MAPPFKHISPSPFDDEPCEDYIKALKDRNPKMGDLGWDAHGLADGAACFFKGIYPIEAPYFWWGEGIRLAWYDEYWGPNTDEIREKLSKKCNMEVSQIAEEINNIALQNRSEMDHQYTYLSEYLCSENKLKIQGLAVESMLCTDRFVDLLLGGDTLGSIPWINAAHRSLIEATVQVQLILGIASTNARSAAMVRHRENHAMREQAVNYYMAHQDNFKSLDSAAEAIAGKIVPVTFRTVRAWLTDYRKQKLRSARRP